MGVSENAPRTTFNISAQSLQPFQVVLSWFLHPRGELTSCCTEVRAVLRHVDCERGAAAIRSCGALRQNLKLSLRLLPVVILQVLCSHGRVHGLARLHAGASQQFLNMLLVALQLQTPLLPTNSTTLIGSFLSVCFALSGDCRLEFVDSLQFLSNLATPVPRQRPRSHRRGRPVQLQYSVSRRALEHLWSLGTRVLAKFHPRALSRPPVGCTQEARGTTADQSARARRGSAPKCLACQRPTTPPHFRKVQS